MKLPVNVFAKSVYQL